ncbi:MAG: transglycosylase domain-containing protein [Caulobacteraceae bacterium]
MLALIAAASVLGGAFDLPPLPPIRRDSQVTYVDRAGAVLGVRGGRFGPPVDLARLPTFVPAAFVAIEDRRFYEHPGFDAMGIARAIVTDLGQGRASQGASTITQQLARNLYLSGERTFERKAQELVYAVELERAYSKRQILGMYLSRVYFGSGAYGIEAAARRYFDKPAAKLTLKEAAILAGIPKSPTAYDPAEQPAAAEGRAALVLSAMAQTGAISEAQRAKAASASPRVWKEAPAAPAQYFVDWLDGQTRTLVGTRREDLVVETTLDLPVEVVDEEKAAAIVARYKAARAGQAALVAVDGRGRIRAMVGGVNYQASPFNRAVDAHRQAGSAWKPFVYLAAMESGRTPDTVAIDEPVTIDGWSPRDFDPGFLGQITLETALAHSINTVAARLADEVGRGAVAAAARRAGIVSPIDTDPAMALGTNPVTPLEMAQAYDTFSNGGDRVAAYGLERIRTVGGAVLYRHRAAPPAPAIANPPLSEMDRMLRAVIASGTGARAAIPGHDLAGKTGTTSDYKDAWFCGFTGGLTTVVWIGRDDATPMRRMTGGGAPAEFWRGFMSLALKRLPSGPIPYGRPAPIPPPAPAPVVASPPVPAEPALPPPG